MHFGDTHTHTHTHRDKVIIIPAPPSLRRLANTERKQQSLQSARALTVRGYSGKSGCQCRVKLLCHYWNVVYGNCGKVQRTMTVKVAAYQRTGGGD